MQYCEDICLCQDTAVAPPSGIPQRNVAYDGFTSKTDLVNQLQKDVLSLQGIKTATEENKLNTGLGIIEQAFPNKTFPLGAVHELISFAQADAAATNGFITALLSKLMLQGGNCLWVSTKRTIYPPALKLFGVAPERIIFIDLPKEKEAVWAFEEALKCEALAAVVGEFKDLSFTQSRRLQLAVEESRVTGFIHRNEPRTMNNTACMTRWKIKTLASRLEEGMPGIGLPCWDVELVKVRNGKPGSWQLQWIGGQLEHIEQEVQTKTLRATLVRTG